MKKYYFVFAIIATLFAVACQQKTGANADAKTAAALTDGTYCYEYRVGQDVTNVKLVIAGNEVTGEMNWIPFEKDSGRGVLKGLRDGNEITAVWIYVIEGSNQTEEVRFKIEGDQLLRKTGELVDANNDGNLKLKDPASAPYGEPYTKVACE